MQNQMVPIHPGEMLFEEFMQPLGISQNKLAKLTGMPQSRLQAILSKKRGLSADTAIRLATFFGNSPNFWLNCQTTYELDMIEYSGKKNSILKFVTPYIKIQHDHIGIAAS